MMTIKSYLFLVLLCAGSTVGIAQSFSDSQLGASAVLDNVLLSLPSLAQLKAQVLQTKTSDTRAHNVPSQHRALFCRFDDKLDQKRIPLRMRLGSLEEVNRLEAKPGFRAGQLAQ